MQASNQAKIVPMKPHDPRVTRGRIKMAATAELFPCQKKMIDEETVI
jgi:hypothetical protein